MTTTANNLRLPYWNLAPELFAAMRQVSERLSICTVESRLIELVYQRVSQINGCAFCLGMHAEHLREAGETSARLDQLAGWRESLLYTPAERAALNWAESLTQIAVTHATDVDYQPLLNHFNARQIAELTFAISQMNAWNRMAIAMRQSAKGVSA